MKKKFFSFILLLFIFQLKAAGQFAEILDLQTDSSRAFHQIKSIKKKSSVYGQKKNLEYTLDAEGDFNRRGQVIKHAFYLPFASWRYNNERAVGIYEYDLQGRLIKYLSRNEYANPALNHDNYYKVYTYSDSSQVPKVVHYRANGSIYTVPEEAEDVAKNGAALKITGM